ncbi:MAG: hypothetical protein HY059_02140 [Proteobacteria bacterium]|nr:hypothetical protein [Pseudomonadota bacterium]
MPSVFTPAQANAYKHPVSPPAVTADIGGRAQGVKNDPTAGTPAPLPPASATFGASVHSFFA